MKKFIKKLMLLLAIVCSILTLQILTGIFIIGSQYTQDYNASLIDKVARLEELKEPKIILVGNSNVSFGFFSPLIEEAFNMPVVNVGLHGGLGNAFHENIAKLAINSGDLIVVCHSTFKDNDSITDVALAWTTLEYHKELWASLRLKDYWDIILGWPDYWFRTFRLWITNTGNERPKPPYYARYTFNEQGDVVIRFDDVKRIVFKPQSVHAPKINDTCVNRLNDLNKYVKERGAVLVVAGYPIGYGKYMTEEVARKIDVFQSELKEKLDCTVISNYRDYFFTYDLFYDTTLHLTEEGAKIRTEQLIKDMKQFFKMR